jgi:hypothetical protein
LQINIRNQSIVRDYGKIGGNSISALVTSLDNKYVFANPENSVLQYRIDTGELVKKYGFDTKAWEMVLTCDSKYMFCHNGNSPGPGNLHQICLKTQKVIKNYGQITRMSDITRMAFSRDNEFLFVAMIAGQLGEFCIKKFCIRNQQLVGE